jgi:hypothetical protein
VVVLLTDQGLGPAASSPQDQPQEASQLTEVRRSGRGRRIAAAALVIAAGLSAIGWRLAGSDQQRPPSVPGSALGAGSSAVPPGAKLISSRSINHWTLRIYASPSGLPLAKVDASYELFDPEGHVSGSGSGSVGASLLAPSGVVNEGGGSSEGPAGWQGICDCQVTNPAIALVRVVSGHKVLDAMVPFTFDAVRFVVVAAINVPTLSPIAIQGLDSKGAILSSVSF